MSLMAEPAVTTTARSFPVFKGGGGGHPKKGPDPQREEETYLPGRTVSLVARKHGIGGNQIFPSPRLMARGALTAVFVLHQSVESIYRCALLVCTFYTRHNRNIAFLRTQAERLDYRLHDIWPLNNRSERAMFKNLKDAYVKARYLKNYPISKEDLT